MRILMINQDQFGYKAGYYHYCKHLVAMGHSIVFLCHDHHLKRIEMGGVETIYVDEPNSVKWRLKFIPVIKKLLREQEIDVALCSYFRGCSILKPLFRKVPLIADIRSGDLAENKHKRKLLNRIMKWEALRFNGISTVSESLAEVLGLKHGCYDIVTLGADVVCEEEKSYNEPFNIVYIGTLTQRDLYKTVQGLFKFHEKYPNVKFKYDIIGFGSDEEEARVSSAIETSGLADRIFFHGRKNYEQCIPFLAQANIGVAFVPMTPYYDCQPSTKIYEYVLSGVYCLATNTYENRILVKPVNGILHDDNADSFCEALEEYYHKDKSGFDSCEIRKSMEMYEWRNVVNNMLLPLMVRVRDNARKTR